MPSSDDLEITLDLDTVRRSADHVRDMLIDLRTRFDLASLEYTKQVRIAPLEIPHSHPTLMLNTWVRDELGLLSTYLHEQMHWYLTWYSHAHPLRWRDLFQASMSDIPRCHPTQQQMNSPFISISSLTGSKLKLQHNSWIAVALRSTCGRCHSIVGCTVQSSKIGPRLPTSTTVRACTHCGPQRICRPVSCGWRRLRQKHQHERRQTKRFSHHNFLLG
jgi:hypothetical protein